MAHTRTAALRRLASAAAPHDPPDADRTLLRAFLASRSEPAFADLVRRHGPMVFAVCRRVLGHAQDAEDACQAAFIVLARKAGSVRGANLAGWLYGVAVRTARGVRIMRDRRRRHELANGRREPAGGIGTDQPAHTGRSLEDQELVSIIDEELAALPDLYRLPVVLCELEGKSRKDAAADLNVPEGTLSSRLAAAKRKLAARLARRGVTASVAAVTAALAGPAAARVPCDLARAATGTIPGSAIAAKAADGVVKALFAAQLKGMVVAVGLALGLVGGGMVATSGTGGTATAAPADPKPAAGAVVDPAELVKQLGDADFATREAAEKALRELGVTAKPALRTATRDPNPEVAKRAAAALAGVRREQLWAAFVRLVGDGQPARDLFAQVTAGPRGVDALEAALDDPTRANDLYRTRTAELLRVAGGHPAVGPNGKADPPDAPDVHAAPPVPLGDVAGWLFLGALQPGTAPWSEVTHTGWQDRLSSHVPFLPEDDYTSAKPIAAAYEGPVATPLKKLTAAWLAKRCENDGLRAGLTLAIRYDIAEAVAAVRTVLKEEKPADVRPWNVAAAAIFLGLHGTKADLPVLARRTTDDREHVTIMNLPPGMDLTFARPKPEDGRDLFCQVRDAAVVSMCRLADKNPAALGFPPFPATKHPNGKPRSLSSATAVGFKAKADRTAAFAKAKAWLDEQKVSVEKPDPARPLVQQLGDPDFAAREKAAKLLRDLGVTAKPALEAGTRDPNPEIARRAGEVLALVRTDARADLVKRFDPAGTADYDHPVWQHYKTIADDSRASRELFARIIANAKWLRTLDNAEADPKSAGHIYRVGIAEMFRDFDRDPAKSPAWPCDRPEEVAYLLLLGDHPDPTPPAKLDGDEVPPAILRNTEFLGRGIIRGEEQIVHARGLELGLEDQWLAGPNRSAVDGPPGMGRVFVKLFAAWLARRDPAAAVVPRGLRIAAGKREPEILPLARRYAANDFEPRRDIPPVVTIAALELLAGHYMWSDLPLFERHFGDETNAAAAEKPRTDGARDYYRPTPLTDTTQLRDVALGLAVLLHGGTPADFGFLVRDGTFNQVGGRYTIPRFTQLHLGFESEAARTVAFKKAKAWLEEQKKPAEKPKAEPPERGRLVWDHFTRVVGDDKASRELFDLIVADPKNLEQLTQLVQVAFAKVGDRAGEYQTYLDRRDELNAKAEKKNPNQLGSSTVVPVPLAEVAGWLLMGTFPRTKGDDPDGSPVRFIDVELGQKPLADALKTGSPLSKPMRKLVAAWLANRGDEYSALHAGLKLGVRYDIAETLPTGRRVIKDYAGPKPVGGTRPYFTAVLRSYGMLVVGKYGTTADLPLFAPHVNDGARVYAHIREKKPFERPGFAVPIDGQDVTTTVGDVALAMSVQLRGGDPRDFGFLWPTALDGAKVADPFSLGVIGFKSKDDRAAAHKKAKAWLDEQKK